MNDHESMEKDKIYLKSKEMKKYEREHTILLKNRVCQISALARSHKFYNNKR